MKIATIVGTRPQFIKYSILNEKLKDHEKYLIHTGQHYDMNMSNIFFEDMKIPSPDINISVGSGTPAFQIGYPLRYIEKALKDYKPDYTMVLGDCNSTLSGALASSKIGIPIIHVESGLRCFDKTVPEEINRILVDNMSNILFCPTKQAYFNLMGEKLDKNALYVGDIRKDILMKYLKLTEHSTILKDINLKPHEYYVTTIHRQKNTKPKRLKEIIKMLEKLDRPVVFPIHPRTKKLIKDNSMKNIIQIHPLGYLDMVKLLANSKGTYTDSGGVMVESHLLGTNTISLRECHEYPEIKDGLRRDDFGDGNAADKIVKFIGGL